MSRQYNYSASYRYIIRSNLLATNIHSIFIDYVSSVAALACKRHKKSEDNAPAPRPVDMSNSGGGIAICRRGKKYRNDLEMYGPEVAEQNRKKRVGIAAAA